MSPVISRRHFLKTTATVSGGLLVAIHLPGCESANGIQNESGVLSPNAFLEFRPDGAIIFTLPRIEMGQGTYTGLTTVIAEELEVDPEKFTINLAPRDKAYNNPKFFSQMTGGSNSLSAHFTPLSQTGADTRQLLINAAAEILQVEAGRA